MIANENGGRPLRAAEPPKTLPAACKLYQSADQPEKPSQPVVQSPLPFAAAEGTANEQRARLLSAVDRLRQEVDLHVRDFILMVLEHQQRYSVGRGPDGSRFAMRASYERIARWPDGLCCSEAKARRTVGTARKLGLVRCDPQRDGSGATVANAYSIDWVGVQKILTLQPRMAATNYAAADGRGMESTGPVDRIYQPAHYDQGHAQPDHGPVAGAQSREDYLLNISSLGSFSDTDSGSGTGGVLKTSRGYAAAAAEAKQQVPLLIDSADRLIDPLPIGKLAYGTFHVLNEGHLSKALPMAKWFRQQLSLQKPITGRSESDLLIVLAVAEFAAAMPKQEVRKNRCAAFATFLNRGVLDRCLRYVPSAREKLDQLVNQLHARNLDLNWPNGATTTANQTGSISTPSLN